MLHTATSVVAFDLVCTKCGGTAKLAEWRCGSCGSPLRVEGKKRFNKGAIFRTGSLWRYSRMLAHVGNRQVTLGEGLTPIAKFDDSLSLKLDYLNPTGSFKDRGSTIAVTTQLGLNGQSMRVHEDSSGNAGASIAAYCARAGIPVTIYVPATASGRKLEQIRSYGADLVLVEGPRDRAATKAQTAGGAYLGHVWNPFFLEGMKTLGYEIAEQFDWRPPEEVYFPSSVGTLLLGLLYGFRELLVAGAIKRMPKLVAVQPMRVSPLYHLLNGLPYRIPEESRSVADAIVSHSPPRLGEMVDEMKKVGGECVALEEDEILDSATQLARRGFFVEPSGAIGYGGYVKRRGEGRANGRAVAVLTGIGLKVGALEQGDLSHP